jgi:hypothetical protein
MDDREAIAHLLGLWLAQPKAEISLLYGLVNRASIERIKRGDCGATLSVIEGGTNERPRVPCPQPTEVRALREADWVPHQ